MAEHDGTSTEVARPSTSTTTLKLPTIFRRSNTSSTSDKQQQKITRSTSVPEVERRSSLSALPIRIRKKKPQPATGGSEQVIKATQLGRLLFSIPSEIFAQILTNLSILDICNLRLTSRALHQILNANAFAITRNCMHDFFPDIASSYVQTVLYPLPAPCPDLSHFLRMARRQAIVDAQIYPLLSFLQMKIYMGRTGTRILSVSDNRQRLIEAFQRPCWTVNHFLEAYRKIMIYEHPSHLGSSDNNSHNNNANQSANSHALCPRCTASARLVITRYPNKDVMPAYHFYQLLLEHLQIAMRPPSSAGPLERRLRGWSKASTMDENLATFLMLGGMPEVRKIAMMQGSYSSRLQVVVDFIHKVREATTVNSILEGAKHGSGNNQFSPTVDATIDGDGEEAEGSSSSGSGAGADATCGGTDLFSSLSPPFAKITQDTVTSLPDIHTFFYDIWKERIDEVSPSNDDHVRTPYPWLQQVMSGSGVDFREPAHRAAPEPPLMLGASPL